MNHSSLLAINPIDGRYADKTKELRLYFSEYALIKYRILVEIKYFIKLSKHLPQLKKITKSQLDFLLKIINDFSEKDALRVKEIENLTNHDVKSVEYYIKEKFDECGLSKFKEFVHFGLTSQDINNTSIPLSLKDSITEVYNPLILKITESFDLITKKWWDISMLAYTHGQPASPTKLGKEIKVFSVRIKEQLNQLNNIPFSAKFGGATGNFNAHYIAYPNINWHKFAEDFINNELKLKRSYPTTQIEHYDNLAALFHCIARINTILIDFAKDMWTYISFDYFKQKINKNEVGSSAMPHKVNPIDFENAEGNLKIANALFISIAQKLPVSRLQRDLTDSTVLRNIGVAFGYSIIAFKSILKGINKIEVNKKEISNDLEKNYIVISEAIQTILRRENYPNPYETLKELTRTNKKITKRKLHDFIDSLNISKNLKKELKNISPLNYTGHC